MTKNADLQHEPLLRVRDLVVRYRTGGAAIGAVERASLDVPRRSITALLGASGCGKTSLLRAVAGFETPQSGSVEIDGETLAGPGVWVEPEKRRIGMVFQEGALFPHLTVRENVAYGLPRSDNGRATRALDLVGLPECGSRFPDELSGGQQQRVALARALAPEPRLILLDEPFANLDAGLRERLREQVRRILRQAGATAVLVTHDQEEALSVADQVAVMADGRILQTGDPETIYRRPATVEVAHFIGEGHLVECAVEGGRAHSAFGATPTGATDGEGLLFVRPEDLGMTPCPDAQGAHGRIVDRRFFGHDVLDRVRLRSGEELEVRVLSSVTLPLGSAVSLTLRPRDLPVFSRSS